MNHMEFTRMKMIKGLGGKSVEREMVIVLDFGGPVSYTHLCLSLKRLPHSRPRARKKSEMGIMNRMA